MGDQPVLTDLSSELAKGIPGVMIPKKMIRSRENLSVMKWLIQWKGLPEDEATWEEREFICRQFQEHHLEDKVNFQGESIDMNRPGSMSKVYQKRGKKLQGGD